MYSMQDKVTAMDWVDSGKSVCVGTSSGSKHEILELSLPDKLLASEEEGAVIKGRDFNVKNGGFCRGEITSIKHIPGTRLCLVVEKNSSTVTAWKMGNNESDMIQKQKEIQGLKSSCPRLEVCIDGQDTPQNFAYGSSTNDISVVDLATFQTVTDSTDLSLSQEVSYLSYQGHNTILCCCRKSGDIVVLDLRDKKVKVTHSPCLGRQAAFWTAVNSVDGCATNQGKTLIIQLSSEGQFIILDPRKINECISGATTHKGAKTDNEHINLEVSSCQKFVSTSGFDSEVDIFCFDSFKNSDENKIGPVFTHEGHVTTCEEPIASDFTVTSHLQHPFQASLILSAASDGSLHAWEYIIK
ncbi:hypothetical protein CHS0354_025011 [Potamilus streckersoni]|nr:hypothetical protein CHS0354_025011 [Potamilus streckersoni]